MQRILLLDNYDSFTYNLKHYLEELDCVVDVFFNDDKLPEVSVYDKIILSPGPGLPKSSGQLIEIIQKFKGQIPILGVCLGMQAIGEVLGGDMYNQQEVKHGVQEKITVENGSPLFKGLANQIEVGLYHSWAINEEGEYKVTGKSLKGVIMAIENNEQKLYGVQFHPESIMTPKGKKILENFIGI